MLLRAIAFLGRQGARATAASIALGLLLPGAGLAKVLLAPLMVALLTLAFLRVDPAVLRRVLAQPRRWSVPLLAAMAGVPLATLALLHLAGLSTGAPGLSLILMMVASAPPIVSSVVFAALIGLDTGLALAVVLTGLLLVPFSAPPLFALMGPAAPEVATATLLIRLALMIGGAALLAAVLRALLGGPRLHRNASVLDGLAVVANFGFILAILDGVAARLFTEPALVLGLLGLAFALASASVGLGYALFAGRGAREALGLGLMFGNRNLGLMLAAVGPAAPDIAWLYVALAQFPIYLTPLVIKRLFGRRAALRPDAAAERP